MMLRTVLTGAVVLLAGCASVTSGTGTMITPSKPAPSSTSSAPSSSAAPSPTEATPSSATSSAATTSCASTADYCEDFSDASSGWPVGNETNYYANYDRYRGGTYRMGERTAKGKTQLAPIDTTTISVDYGVQIDVDAVLGNKAPATSYIGLVCWDHAASSNGAESGFLFFVRPDSVDVTLLPDTGSGSQTLNDNQGGDFVQPYPATNHLTVTCVQKHVGGGTSADLTLAINGSTVLHEQYAKSVKNYAWAPGSRAGLLVAGEKADVFYDNFSITGI